MKFNYEETMTLVEALNDEIETYKGVVAKRMFKDSNNLIELSNKKIERLRKLINKIEGGE